MKAIEIVASLCNASFVDECEVSEMTVKAVTIYIDADKELDAIRLRPVGAELADKVSAQGKGTGTAEVTYSSSSGTDVKGDISWEF